MKWDGCWVPHVDRTDKARAIRTLFESSTQGVDYYLLLTLSVVIATIGVAYQNIPLLVASMLIAPLLYPVLSLGLGVVLHDMRVLELSSRTIAWSVGVAVSLAWLVGVFLPEPSAQTREALGHMFVPSLGYLVVAVSAGVAVTYALVRPHLSEHLPGVAIAVALLPPLATVGASLAWGLWEVAVSAFALFGLNVGGVVAAAVVVFSLFDMYAERPAAQAALAAQQRMSEEEGTSEPAEEAVKVSAPSHGVGGGTSAPQEDEQRS